MNGNLTACRLPPSIGLRSETMQTDLPHSLTGALRNQTILQSGIATTDNSIGTSTGNPLRGLIDRLTTHSDHSFLLDAVNEEIVSLLGARDLPKRSHAAPRSIESGQP